MTPRLVARHLYIERCRLKLNHQGDHQPGTPEPIDAATELIRHDQEHGHYQEDR